MFETENFSYVRSIHPFEWVMLGLYMILLIGISFFTQVKNIKQRPEYRYYMRGVLLKMVGAVIFCLIYIYHYNGGDTVCYYETTRALVNLGLKDFDSYLTVMSSTPSNEVYSLFDSTTGYPWPFMYFDQHTLFVAKLLSPILFISFKSFLVATVILSWITYFGIWRFYRMVCSYYPGMEKWLAYAVLFVPSVVFWSSGILKDSFTFAAVCWFIVSFDNLVIRRRKMIRNGIVLIAAAYVMFAIKPYIFFSLLPGALIWATYAKIIKYRSRFLRLIILPMIYVFAFVGSYFALSVLGDSLGKFSMSKMLVTASVTQKDLKQDYYQGSSFDIGEFEPTINGVLSKSPIAMRVGLFQPFIFEARNAVMLISGLENLLYLILTLMLVYRMIFNTKLFFKTLGSQPILLFMISFALIFSVLVGLSTSNFGALVRFKIPFLPSFVCAIVILNILLYRAKNQSPSSRRQEMKRSMQQSRVSYS
jgi:hypothetical protein